MSCDHPHLLRGRYFRNSKSMYMSLQVELKVLEHKETYLTRSHKIKLFLYHELVAAFYLISTTGTILMSLTEILCSPLLQYLLMHRVRLEATGNSISMHRVSTVLHLWQYESYELHMILEHTTVQEHYIHTCTDCTMWCPYSEWLMQRKSNTIRLHSWLHMKSVSPLSQIPQPRHTSSRPSMRCTCICWLCLSAGVVKAL